MAHHLEGWTAIAFAEKHGGTLKKYRDPTERPLKRVSIEKAKRVAREDPLLIYMDVSARKMKSNPSKRKTRKRVSSALKKWVKAETAKVRKNAGRKVKGGKAVSLKDFTGRVIRKSNGQVQIIGRGKKA